MVHVAPTAGSTSAWLFWFLQMTADRGVGRLNIVPIYFS